MVIVPLPYQQKREQQIRDQYEIQRRQTHIPETEPYQRPCNYQRYDYHSPSEIAECHGRGVSDIVEYRAFEHVAEYATGFKESHYGSCNQDASGKKCKHI